MRWVKHMTAAWDDERIAKLVGKGGVEGLAAYGIWWRLIEIIAARVDGKSIQCSVTYDVTRWSLLLSLRGSHVRHWLEKLALTGVLTAEWVGTEITVTIPKLLKYRDEYSKKSVQGPVQEKEREQKESTTEEEHKTNTPAVADKALTPHQLEMKRLKALGWKGVAKTTDAVCENIIVTIRDADFAESTDLKSAYMIFQRLCWFVEFAGYFWECGSGPDQRRAREMYFEMVPDAGTKELVESAIEAQKPAMLEREKQYRTQPHNWLKSRSWEAARTLFGQ